GNSVSLAIGEGDDSVFLINQLGSHEFAVEEIRFADGTVWTEASIREQIIADQVSSDDDDIFGTGFDDEIHAGAGNDYVDGSDGANVLDGGSGDDVLTGGWGAADTYVFTGAFGHDEITNFEPNGFDQFEHRFPLDVIQFDNTVFASFADVLAAATQ